MELEEVMPGVWQTKAKVMDPTEWKKRIAGFREEIKQVKEEAK